MIHPATSSAMIGALLGVPLIGLTTYLLAKEKEKVEYRTMHEWSFKIIGGSDELVLSALLENTKTTFIVNRRGKGMVEAGIPLTFDQLVLLGRTVEKVVAKFQPPELPSPPPKPKPDDRLGELSPGLFNILESHGILTLEQLATCNSTELLKLRRFGRGRLHETRVLLKKHGLKLAKDP